MTSQIGGYGTKGAKSLYYREFNKLKKKHNIQITSKKWIGTNTNYWKKKLNQIQIQIMINEVEEIKQLTNEQKEKSVKDKEIIESKINDFDNEYIQISFLVKICIRWGSGKTNVNKLLSFFEEKESYIRIILEDYQYGFGNNERLYDIVLQDVENAVSKGIIYIPSTYEYRDRLLTVYTHRKNLLSQLTEQIDKYVTSCSSNLVFFDYKKVSTAQIARQNWSQMSLRELIPLKLTEFINVIETKNEFNCVKSALKRHFPKLDVSELKDIGVSVEELQNFSIKHSLPILILKNDLTKYYESEIKDKKMVVLACNNHLYYFGTQQPNKVKEPTKVIITYNNLEKINEIVSQHNNVFNVVISTYNSVLSFADDKHKYIQNPEYEMCYDILKKFEWEHNITDNIKLFHICRNLEKKYLFNNKINSIFPNGLTSDFKLKSAIWRTEFIDYTKPIAAEDMFKSHTSGLYSLPFLINFDYRTSQINTSPITIKPNNMYNVEFEENIYKNILHLEDYKLYDGYNLIELQKRNIINFKLIEEIECNITPNYFTNMIKEMIEKIGWNETIKHKKFVECDEYDELDNGIEPTTKSMSLVNVEEPILKKILNIFIGSFASNVNTTNKNIFNGIYNRDEQKRHSGHVIKINDEYSINYVIVETISNLENRLPIYNQILFNRKIALLDRILTKNISPKNIIQINTDCITFYGEPSTDYKNELNCWRKSEFLDIGNVRETNMTFKQSLIMNNPITENQNICRKLILVDAGAGKTHYILNSVIPDLEIRRKKYIVLATEHSTLTHYNELNINSDVLTNYAYHSYLLNKYDYVIFDEYGKVGDDGNKLMYYLSITPINYICVGDFGQLTPVKGQQITTSHYMKWLFNNFSIPSELKGNMRNTFNEEYYRHLREDTYNNLEEIRKYSTRNYYDAEAIICIRNETCDKYNNMMLEHLNKKYDDIGVKYICKTNKYDEVKNNTPLEIISSNEKEVILTNKIHKLSIKPKELKNNKKFKLGYAYTTYAIQGKSIKSYFWSFEDDDLLKYYKKDEKNRISYTIISRIKTKNSNSGESNQIFKNL